MPLLDQFRRPDRGNVPPPVRHQAAKKPLDDVHTPASTSTAVAEEENLPNHASEEDAA